MALATASLEATRWLRSAYIDLPLSCHCSHSQQFRLHVFGYILPYHVPGEVPYVTARHVLQWLTCNLQTFPNSFTHAAPLSFSVGLQEVFRALAPELGQPYSTLRGHPRTSCGYLSIRSRDLWREGQLDLTGSAPSPTRWGIGYSPQVQRYFSSGNCKDRFWTRS